MTLLARLTTLEELARKATPGPWKSRKSLHGNRYRTVQFDQGPQRAAMYTSSELLPGDAAHIAACSPSVILELIAEVRAVLAQQGPGLVDGKGE